MDLAILLDIHPSLDYRGAQTTTCHFAEWQHSAIFCISGLVFL